MATARPRRGGNQDIGLVEPSEAISHQDLYRLMANGSFLGEWFGQPSEDLVLPPPE
jgi:hypothetical protein